MRIYVAARLSDAPRVAGLIAALREHGHIITHDWTHNEPATQSECAAWCLLGVARCDVLVLYPHPSSKGAYVEVGVALGLGRGVIVIGDPATECHTVFLRLPHCHWVPTEDLAILWLHGVGRGGA